MKFAGFFKELNLEISTGENLRESIHFEPHSDKDKIILYLSSGNILRASPGISFDVLSQNEISAGSSSIFTDGEWIWHGSLKYYVNKYNVILPEQLILHMQKNDWKVPHKSEISLLIPALVYEYKYWKSNIG